METEQKKTKIPVPPVPNQVETFMKVAGTTIFILAGTWLVLKISKEMLKEMEGMGL
jgi:hypothetical protein